MCVVQFNFIYTPSPVASIPWAGCADCVTRTDKGARTEQFRLTRKWTELFVEFDQKSRDSFLIFFVHRDGSFVLVIPLSSSPCLRLSISLDGNSP